MYRCTDAHIMQPAVLLCSTTNLKMKRWARLKLSQGDEARTKVLRLPHLWTSTSVAKNLSEFKPVRWGFLIFTAESPLIFLSHFLTCENQIDSSIVILQEFSTQVKFYVWYLMQHKLSVNDIRLEVLLAWNTECLLMTLLTLNFGKSLTALISDCSHFHII